MIYYILIATFLFIGFFSRYPDRHYKVSMVLLFVFTAFRDTSLGDYENTTYKTIFMNAPLLPNFRLDTLEYEAGYTLIESITKLFSQDFRAFQVIYTLIAILLLAVVVNKLKFESRDKNLFLFIYFCMRFFINNFIILRQNIANMIIWYIVLSGLSLLVSILLVALSAQFHITSYANMVVIPVYKWIEKVDIRKIYIVTIITSIVLVFSSSGVANNIINMFISFAGEKYSKYLIVEGGTATGFNAIYYLLRAFFFSLFYWKYDLIETENKKCLFCISGVAVVLGSINVDIFSRFMEFYMIGIYGIMALSYRVFNEKSQKIYIFILYFAMLMIMIRQLNLYGAGYLKAYGFFF